MILIKMINLTCCGAKYRKIPKIIIKIVLKYNVKQSKNGKFTSIYKASSIDFETQISLRRKAPPNITPPPKNKHLRLYFSTAHFEGLIFGGADLFATIVHRLLYLGHPVQASRKLSFAN